MNELIATDKQVVIFGLGVTGLSVVRYLLAEKKSFVVIDTRENPPGKAELRSIAPEVKGYFGEVSAEVRKIIVAASEVVLSPGVPREHQEIQIALEAGVSVVGDIELFLRAVKAPVIGITGSNGKTTVTTMMGLAAEKDGKNARVAGNIGTPALDVLGESVELYILELSSFQLESIARPNFTVACLLNVSEDHMDRYDSLQRYCMAKQRIFQSANNVVYNLEDKLTQPPVIENVTRFGFGLREFHEQGERKYWYSEKGGMLYAESNAVLSTSQVQLVGQHNVANILAVFAMSDAIGVSREAVIEMLKTFPGLPHRCQKVAEKYGLVFVNDSKATNVGATESAIAGLARDYSSITLIAGGEGKGADFSALAKVIDERVDLLILIGRDGALIAEGVTDKSRVLFASSLDEAVELAVKTSRKGSLVLLSPACASFDMFKSFEDRGEQFITAVERMVA
ncbi:UDP-N-acetylmuramoyl-L-alanine--D-glutamate ligase [Teredinibacter franksiae]|uniref:UDP-N-acetylmuramoyl-L-alanine--D-glutamate ligase n=1 Tax=Teredinibacter franksiae TaxID=2761453 RepID=UPI001624D527|nr:UDP-N-acetylmuramoyl-L-alanine--D-glutamate ligase [Teredinibacter franksiae]